MNSHANLLLKLHGQSRGRAAEYWGADYLASDKQVLLFDLPEKAKLIYAKQPASYKSYVDAFVKGINDYANSHPAEVDTEMKIVLPVTGADVFANMERAIFRFLTANEREAAERTPETGSNAYAIGASRSASGNAMLVMNPHLPWRPDFTSLFEAHLNAPGLHAYGATMVRAPLLFIAFNDNLGWTFTTNTLDATDRYELTMQGDRYLLDSAAIAFERKTKTIRIKQAGGGMTVERMEIKISKQGPVMGERNNKAYAMRIAGLDNAGVFEEYYRMLTAKNFHDFEKAVKTLQLPYFNILYADKEGNIFYLFNGDIPKRPEGDFAYWRGTIDGGKSKLIWKETLPYEQLPKFSTRQRVSCKMRMTRRGIAPILPFSIQKNFPHTLPHRSWASGHNAPST